MTTYGSYILLGTFGVYTRQFVYNLSTLLGEYVIEEKIRIPTKSNVISKWEESGTRITVSIGRGE